ncbi:MAG: HPr kinase [Firmicutes bacterium]|nr:HPr kinase [Bacillota bacterium]
MSEQCFKNNSISSYNYEAFGLNFDSQIILPELARAIGKMGDVRINYGDVPKQVESPIEETHYYQASSDEFLLRVDGVATFYVDKGEQIIVKTCNSANPKLVRLYLLGTVMGILLMQRGILPIHGSTVDINSCGVLFTGISGAGKSTIAAALHKRGYLLLADDVSVLTCAQGRFQVQPGYPQQKLWPDSAAMLGIDTTTSSRVAEGRDKCVVPVYERFSRLPLPIIVIYQIVVQPCNDISILPLRGAVKLATIMGNTYRAEFINCLGKKFSHFKQCADLAKQVQVFRLTRPANRMLLDRQIETVLKHYTETYSNGINDRFKGRNVDI